MLAQLVAFALFVFCTTVVAAEEKRTLTLATSRALPKFERVAIYKSGAARSGPAQAKPVFSGRFGAAIVLPHEGPFDVYVKPVGQGWVPAATKLRLKPGSTRELKLGDLFGAVQVFQSDASPRLGKIIVTAQDDPGPDEKGHTAVQVGTEYREELVVPAGDYAVWLVPGNGARGQRIADRIRVLAGRTVRIGD